MIIQLMRLQIKKIIAREFLILIVTICIGLLAFSLTYPYNFCRQHQVDNLTNKIITKENLADSLSTSFDTKIKKKKWLNKKLNEEFDLSSDTIYLDSIWIRLVSLAQNDSIKFRWDGNKNWIEIWTPFFKKIGFNNPSSLQEFILTNNINKSDIENNNSSLKIKDEIKSLKLQKREIENKILSYYEQVNFGIVTLIIFGIILFGLRYVVYSVKWSLKILKQKTD
jgi:hypothetical protein